MDLALAERRQFAALCASAGAYTPAFGMIGTLVGLVQMLQHLAEPAALGPAMAVAFLSTLYGAVLANVVCLPLAARQRAQVAALARAQELTRAGVLGIVHGEGPAELQRRLAAHLDAVPPRPARLAGLRRAA
jgi:chemotaxis protein MotA